MALEHALLVALRERPASGLELARRFERSIGFFWHATHQQIYRVLARMEGEGWLTVRTVAQTGRPDKKEYAVSGAGADVLVDWLAADTPVEPLRSELAVKLRAASYGDRTAVRRLAEEHLAEHHARLAGVPPDEPPSSTPTPIRSPVPTSTATSSCVAGCGSRSSGSAG